MDEVGLQHPSFTDGKRYGLFMERHSRKRSEYTDDVMSSLRRGSKTRRESFLPSIATEAESPKEKLHPSPWEACVKPATASLKTHCHCQVSFTSLPSRVSSSPQKETKPHLSFKVTLHTNVFFFFKEITESTRSNFYLICTIRVSMLFLVAMSVYSISAESQELWNINISQNEILFFLLKVVFTNSPYMSSRKICRYWNTIFCFQYNVSLLCITFYLL